MKHAKKILICSAYAMILGAILAGAVFLSGAKIGSVVFGQSGAQVLSTEKHTINKNNLKAFDSLDLNIDKADVNLIPSDHYEADFVYYGNNSTFNCSVENGTLKISTNEKHRYEISLQLTPLKLNNTLEIYYPKNVKLKNIKINNKDGNFTSDGFTSDSTNLSLPYGNIYINNADCGNISINLKNGKCQIKNAEAATLSYNNNYGNGTFEKFKVGSKQSVHMISTDGALTLKDFSCENLEANSSYGNINIDSIDVSALNSTLGDGRLSIKNSSIGNSIITNSSGRVSIDGIKSGGANIKCNDGEININGELKGKTQLNSDYGKVSVKTSLPKDKYSYTAVTKYGNVEIDGKKYGMNISSAANSRNSLYAEAEDGDVSISFGI